MEKQKYDRHHKQESKIFLLESDFPGKIQSGDKVNRDNAPEKPEKGGRDDGEKYRSQQGQYKGEGNQVPEGYRDDIGVPEGEDHPEAVSEVVLDERFQVRPGMVKTGNFREKENPVSRSFQPDMKFHVLAVREVFLEKPDFFKYFPAVPGAARGVGIDRLSYPDTHVGISHSKSAADCSCDGLCCKSIFPGNGLRYASGAVFLSGREVTGEYGDIIGRVTSMGTHNHDDLSAGVLDSKVECVVGEPPWIINEPDEGVALHISADHFSGSIGAHSVYEHDLESRQRIILLEQRFDRLGDIFFLVSGRNDQGYLRRAGAGWLRIHEGGEINEYAAVGITFSSG